MLFDRAVIEVYVEEEDCFLLFMLDRYGVDGEGVYERIRDKILR